MEPTSSKYYVGTSGWSYSSFKGVLYPEGLSPKDWLSFYAQRFNTVEINATFYRTPRKSTFEKWYQETPVAFVFSVKAHQSITHLRRLKEVESELKTFYQSIVPLKEKAKVILFQLPPSLKFEEEIVEAFLKKLSTEFKHVIEVRNKSFHQERFYELLSSKGISLCFSDFGGRYPSWVEVITTDFLYIRMHGRERVYFSNYSEEELRDLALLVKRLNHVEAYIYFDNTGLGFAVPNAQRLKDLLTL